jgi:hypothetical protein
MADSTPTDAPAGVPPAEHLFKLPSDAYAVTSDDCYTPRWVFDAMGLEFDLDVAAPPGGPWHVPAKRYYTAEDDGLAQPWDGLIWCNPPYSNFWPWSAKWAAHDRGVLMGIVLPETAWLPPIFTAADVVAFCAPEFSRPDGGKPIRLRQKVFVAFRGVGTEPAERLADADPYGAVLYGRSAA